MLARMSAWASSSRWSRLDFTMETEPSGLVSVMPQPWVTGMPILARKPSDSARGTAEPPHTRARRLERSWPSMASSRPIQMVGTPAATVTFSPSSSRSRPAAERSGPGMIRSAPVATHTWGRPQALTWNIGTTGRMRSRSEQASMSALVEAKACSHDDRWL